jgi:hypothetical protein
VLQPTSFCSAPLFFPPPTLLPSTRTSLCSLPSSCLTICEFLVIVVWVCMSYVRQTTGMPPLPQLSPYTDDPPTSMLSACFPRSSLKRPSYPTRSLCSSATKTQSKIPLPACSPSSRMSISSTQKCLCSRARSLSWRTRQCM